MKKILLIVNDCSTIINFRAELLMELVKTNTVFVVVPNNKRNKEILDIGCSIVNVEVQRKGKNPIKDFRYYLELKRVLQSVKPDIVFTFTIKPNIYGGLACSKLRIPYIVNITGLGTAVEKRGIMQKITLYLYKKGIKKANMVFFQNKFNMDFMVSHNVIGKECALIPGSGVNITRFKYVPYPNSDTINFVYISRVMKEKGIVEFLKAAQIMKKEYPNCFFHVFGPCEDNCEQLIYNANKNGYVIYHGPTENPPEVYSMASCIVLPTYYPEGMSNVLLESSATGRPIITTDRPGCKEIVDDGINGFIVKEKNENDLVEKMKSFLLLPKKKRAEMGLAGRQKVVSFFDRTIVINKYIDEMNRILKLDK